MKAKLTGKQQAFVAEYLVDLNATQAAIRAGYSKKTAKQMGTENLAKPVIKELIDKEKAARIERVQYSADDVLTDLVRIARFDIRELYNDNGDLKPVSEWSDDAAMVISSVDVNIIKTISSGDDEQIRVAIKKLKIEQRTKAIELAGRHVKVMAFDNTVTLDIPPHVSRNFTGRKAAGLD
jgi:phage terminase small subunit